MPHTFKVMVLILILHTVAQVIQIRHDDITADEEDHLIYGVAIWKGDPSRRVEGRDFRSTMPVTLIHALPRVIEQLLQPGKKKTDWGKGDIKAGRYMNLVFTLGLLVHVFLFAREIFGPLAALFSLAIAAADPNVLAHGHLVTTDMAATFFCVATLYHFFQWLQLKQRMSFYLFSLSIALAQVAKVNSLLLYPICVVILLMVAIQQKSYGFRRSLTFLLSFIFIQLLVINLAFQFDQTGFLPDKTAFQSSFMQGLFNRFNISLPSPLPLPYVDTFDQIYFEMESRDGLPLNYLMGQLSKEGFWNYFIICMGIKTPVATLAVMLAGILMIFLQARYKPKPVVFLFVPALFIFWFISSAAVQNGYRYALPVLALGIISTGAMVNQLIKLQRGWLLICLSLVMVLVETGTVRNGFIPFTNWLVPDKKNAWLWLADSNLNWEQNHNRLKDYLQKHPDLIYNPASPVKGKIAVHVNELAGIWHPGKYQWLSNGYTPVGQLWQCYILYDTR